MGKKALEEQETKIIGLNEDKEKNMAEMKDLQSKYDEAEENFKEAKEELVTMSQMVERLQDSVDKLTKERSSNSHEIEELQKVRLMPLPHDNVFKNRTLLKRHFFVLIWKKGQKYCCVGAPLYTK